MEQPLKARIKKLQEVTGWSIAELAEIANVSQSAVRQWLGQSTKEIKSIGNMQAAENIEAKSGFAALWVAKGAGPMLAVGPGFQAPPGASEDRAEMTGRWWSACHAYRRRSSSSSTRRS